MVAPAAPMHLRTSEGRGQGERGASGTHVAPNEQLVVLSSTTEKAIVLCTVVNHLFSLLLEHSCV